jgi:DNA-binding NtrC family response regulator
VAPIAIAALTDRPEDILPLLEHFAAKAAADYGVPRISFSAAATEKLTTYHWPGNVRELENMVRYLTCLQGERPLEPSDLAVAGMLGDGEQQPSKPTSLARLVRQPMKIAKEAMVDEFERAYLTDALQRANGNVSEAARSSGKHRRAFFELMRKHGITASGGEG